MNQRAWQKQMARQPHQMGWRRRGYRRPPGLMGLGAADPAVAMYQKNLNVLGYKGANGKPLVADGVWGRNTDYAQVAFNKAQGYTDAPKGFNSALAAQAAEMASQASAGNYVKRATDVAQRALVNLVRPKPPAAVQAAAPSAPKQVEIAPMGGPEAPRPGFIDSMKEKWSGLSTAQKMLVGGGSVLIVVGVVAMTVGKKQRFASTATAGLGGWRRLHAKKTGVRQHRRRPKGRR